MTTLSLALVSLALGAEAAPFPLGLYNATTPEDYPLIASVGFTAVDVRDSAPGRQQALSAFAAEAGLRVMATPRGLHHRPRGDLSWPVVAWHLFDEPEVNRDSTASIAGLSSAIAAWDPGVPRLIVIGEGRAASEYARWADIIALDWYPVPHLPLASLGEQLDIARAGTGKKTLWAILQAMDWRDYPQRNPQAPRIGRFPEYWELRFMSLLALAQGAEGLFFYTYTKPDKRTLKEFPEQWAVLKDVVSELNTLKPFLDAGPGTRLPGKTGRWARRWTLGRRRLTIVADAASPKSPLVMHSP